MSRRHTGMTLLEMMAALVLISLLVALTGQLLFEAQRLQRSASAATPVGLDLALLRWQESVEAYVPGHPLEASALNGDATRLALPTGLPPWPNLGGAQGVVWRIDDGAEGHRLLAERQLPDAAQAASASAVGLPQGPWVFRYAGVDGRWLEAWPPPWKASEDDRRLMLVAIVDRRDGTPLLVARPAAEARAWGSLRLLGTL